MTKIIKQIPQSPFIITGPTIGSDPEVFIYSDEAGRIVPVLDKLGGTKYMPRPVGDSLGFFVQEDNVLGEYNIPPTKTRTDFIAAIELGLKYLANTLPPGHKPLIQSSYRFQPEELEDERAKELGCSPDYNAWTGAQNPLPNVSLDPTFRTGGGHVIIGYNNPSSPCNIHLIRMMDAYLGIPSVLLDKDTERRRLYGKAGAFREKEYGVEYRTLSSFWIKEPKLTGWVFDQTMNAIKAVNEGNDEILNHEALIVNTINTSDADTAELFIEQYNIQMP